MEDAIHNSKHEKHYRQLLDYWGKEGGNLKQLYEQKTTSFIPYLLPEVALKIPASQLLHSLKVRFGDAIIECALDPAETIPSPITECQDSEWIKTTNMVGINVRTIGSFWNMVKYALTLSNTQTSIHILPIWEVGVVASLYGMASWQINPEFFSTELYDLYPHLDSVEKQLKVSINLLHVMGKVVGMDVIPHTDRYSEIVLANPFHFEWLQRQDKVITNHEAQLHLKVQEALFQFLIKNGSATPEIALPSSSMTFFSTQFGAANRRATLFGSDKDYGSRGKRRALLIDYLFEHGYEPVPATMAPPYRGLEVDTRPSAKTVDAQGKIWREYKMAQPEAMSRVFGPLTRYKLYERLNDNQNWEIDFGTPRKSTWEYICHQYWKIQQEYNFDFMRGDMSHVQMRPDGVPAKNSSYYDLHQAVKAFIQKDKPYFGYFAETFLAAPNVMGYGDEVDHLEQSNADSTLGDLQSMVVGSDIFLQNFRWYLDLLQTRQFAPNFTIMTGDKDDPRFDKFYIAGNEIRFFIALFLTDMPSYMGLGFETRDQHLKPAPNEHYTKLYVFQISEGPKATHGPFRWGKNGLLFRRLTALKSFAEKILPEIQDTICQWLLYPNPTAGKKIIAWTQKNNPKFLFVANLNTEQSAKNIKIPRPKLVQQSNNPTTQHSIKQLTKQPSIRLSFSTSEDITKLPSTPIFNGNSYHIHKLQKGEGRVYQII